MTQQHCRLTFSFGRTVRCEKAIPLQNESTRRAKQRSGDKRTCSPRVLWNWSTGWDPPPSPLFVPTHTKFNTKELYYILFYIKWIQQQLDPFSAGTLISYISQVTEKNSLERYNKKKRVDGVPYKKPRPGRRDVVRKRKPIDVVFSFCYKGK